MKCWVKDECQSLRICMVKVWRIKIMKTQISKGKARENEGVRARASASSTCQQQQQQQQQQKAARRADKGKRDVAGNSWSLCGVYRNL